MGVRAKGEKEQLAAHQLSKESFSGCTGPSILVWGDGGFGPTSHGYASAPNQRLRRLLSKYIPVIVSSEYLSSQRSACCLSRMKDCRKIQPGMKRVTVKQCTSCQTLLSRDVSLPASSWTSSSSSVRKGNCPYRLLNNNEWSPPLRGMRDP